jgi:chromosome segregation protein
MQTRLQQEQQLIEAMNKELSVLNEELNTTTQQIKEAEEAYQLAEKDYNAAFNVYNESNLWFTRLQSKIAALQQELTFKQTQLNDLHVQVEENAVQLTEVSAQITEGENGLKISEEELHTLLHTKEAEEKRLNESDTAYYNHRNTLQEKESELRHKIKSRELVDQLLSEIKDKLNELKLNLAGMRERLHVEFRIELDDILDEPRKTTSVTEDLQASADRMRKRLENIGEINPTAIEAFVEMKKRYEFILEQKNDLTSAKESLLQTIEEVELTANQQFLDTFKPGKGKFPESF